MGKKKRTAPFEAAQPSTMKKSINCFKYYQQAGC